MSVSTGPRGWNLADAAPPFDNLIPKPVGTKGRRCVRCANPLTMWNPSEFCYACRQSGHAPNEQPDEFFYSTLRAIDKDGPGPDLPYLAKRSFGRHERTFWHFRCENCGGLRTCRPGDKQRAGMKGGIQTYMEKVPNCAGCVLRINAERHGMAWKYNDGCRCPECTEAGRVARRARKEREKAQ